MQQQKKYKLDKKDFVPVHGCASKIYRIIALRDFSDVKAGDKGGYIQSEYNLSHEGDCWVYDDAYVLDNALVGGNARISDDAVVQGNSYVAEEVRVSENACILDSAYLLGETVVYGQARIYGRVELCMGNYNSSPLHIQTPRYDLTLNANTHIVIDFKCLTFEEWLGEGGDSFAQLYQFNKTEKAMFESYIKLMQNYANTLNP